MDIIKYDSNLLDLVKNLQKEIVRRKWAEKKACDALDYVESIIDSIQSPLIVLDDEYKIVSANVPFFMLFALSFEESIGKKFFEIENCIFDIEGLKDLVFSEKDNNLPIQLYQDFNALGEKYLQVKCVNLQYNVKHLKFKLVIINDITDFINNQKILERTIIEKQILISEVQHRVKNNLYMIESLLKLEMESLTNPDSMNAFQMTITRIHGIGLLYEKLYRAKELEKISIKEYLPDLINDIRNLFLNDVVIEIAENNDDFQLDGKILFPLGLIMNELITNAMKYAFAGKAKGVIKIFTYNNNNRLKFIVHDNGTGFTDTMNNINSFGFQLINIFAEQLNGKITFDQENGTKCTLEFSIENTDSTGGEVCSSCRL